MSEFSVSRVTIRRALKELVNDALLAPRQGSGYKVQALLQQPLNRITGFSEDCRRRGLKPGSIWLSCEDVACDDDEATHFKLEPKTIVVRINRFAQLMGCLMLWIMQPCYVLRLHTLPGLTIVCTVHWHK